MSAEFVAMDPTGTVLARMKDNPLHQIEIALLVLRILRKGFVVSYEHQEGTHGTI